jgi:hypothetical protein
MKSPISDYGDSAFNSPRARVGTIERVANGELMRRAFLFAIHLFAIRYSPFAIHDKINNHGNRDRP